MEELVDVDRVISLDVTMLGLQLVSSRRRWSKSWMDVDD